MRQGVIETPPALDAPRAEPRDDVRAERRGSDPFVANCKAN